MKKINKQAAALASMSAEKDMSFATKLRIVNAEIEETLRTRENSRHIDEMLLKAEEQAYAKLFGFRMQVLAKDFASPCNRLNYYMGAIISLAIAYLNGKVMDNFGAAQTEVGRAIKVGQVTEKVTKPTVNKIARNVYKKAESLPGDLSGEEILSIFTEAFVKALK